MSNDVELFLVTLSGLLLLDTSDITLLNCHKIPDISE